ncbi:LysR family transcriptional regulator [Albimonas sp. CAU 1670]|uniref:LysR family transcriptional regulator n=1 Tax=Albimonas sp. CAU 1670 TaxID=3032599 RepID=UPI0023D9ED01|nr:LysR family transcriptional regulator [Albimonas sp. CAU 1670]MDF2231714.1 LysR family transcriptional regulator [Albimonas sp. CAU 1670]
MKDLDWNRARAFLVTAEAGSLSAAARRLGLTQPTLSRQVAALEADLDATLFERIGKRLVLTETGETLLEHVRAMGEAASAMTIAASGRSQSIEGRVSISASDVFAACILPEIVERIRRDAPRITLAIVSSNALSDLQRREADIAIRHVRPEEDGLVGKLVRESKAGFYAARSWVERHGAPASVSDIAREEFIGFEDIDPFSAFLRGVGADVTANDFRLMSESGVVVWELMKRGLGVCVMAREIAMRTEDVVELFPDAPATRFPVWLVTHRELRTSRRIRLVYDILADELARIEDVARPRRQPGA